MEIEIEEVQSLCSICNEALDDATTLTIMKKKGLATFIEKSKSREDEKWTSWIDKESITLHELCRKRYSSLRNEIARKRPLVTDVNEEEPPSSICLRSRILPPVSDTINSSLDQDQQWSSVSSPVNSLSLFDDVSEVPFLNFLCFLCGTEVKQNGKEFKQVHEKWVFDMFMDEARRKGDDSGSLVLHCLERTGFGGQTLFYHTTCRKKFFADASDTWDYCTNSDDDDEAAFIVNPDVLFDFSNLCFLCGEKLKGECRHIQQRFLFDRFIDRSVQKGDEHGCLILNRLRRIGFGVQKLNYHTDCRAEFFEEPCNTLKKEKDILFEKVCSFIESTKGILVDYKSMHEMVKGTSFANNRTLFPRLQEKYADDIHIVQHKGRYPVIYYKMFDVMKMCNDCLAEDGSLNDFAKRQLLFTASQILREEVMTHEYGGTEYPPAGTFLENAVAGIPPHLKDFLSNLLKGVQDKKVAIPAEEENVRCYSIAHSIVSFLRPQLFISNLQMALGSYVYRKTRSKIIISVLSKLGVCPSYYSIQKHEGPIIADPPTAKLNDDVFLQFVFSQNKTKMMEATTIEAADHGNENGEEVVAAGDDQDFEDFEEVDFEGNVEFEQSVE